MLNALKADLLFTRGQKQFRAGKIEASLELFDQGLEIAPGAAGPHLHKAIALAGQKKYAEAAVCLRQAIDLDPECSAHHLWLGIIHFDLDQMQDALTQFDTALSLSRDNDLVKSYSYLTLAVSGKDVVKNCNRLLERVEFTNAEFQSRLLLFSESFALQHGAEARYLNDTMFHETYLERTAKGASVLGPWYTRIVYAFSPAKKKAALHYGKGVDYLKKGRFDRAETAFEQALDILPDFDEARILLVDLYLYRKQIEAVESTLKAHPAYRRIAPIVYGNAPLDGREKELGGHLGLVLALGIYHFYARQYKKAIRCIEFIAGVSGTYFDDYYLGLCYLAEGDPETAATCFKSAMQRLNPALASSRLNEVLRLCGTG